MQDPAQVAGVVAAALGVREQPGIPAAEAVGRVLARQQLLLVLDNCEHVIGAAAQLCAGLLAACDDVRVLATSREPLAVAGEARYRLGPLTLPGPVRPVTAAGRRRWRCSPTGPAAPTRTSRSMSRPRPRWPGWWPGWTGCRWRSSWPRRGWRRWEWAQLLDRLDDRFALLAGADRLAALRGSGRWRPRWTGATGCWMRPGSGCSGRCRCSRARSRWRPPRRWPGEAAGPAVLHLVDCSLLVPPRPGPDGRARYLMLQTLRAYGARLLADAGEQDAGRRRAGPVGAGCGRAGRRGIADYAGELAAAARAGRRRSPPCRQALAWTMQHDPAAALRLVNALSILVGPAGPAGRSAMRCSAKLPGTPSQAATRGVRRSTGSASRL